MRAASMRSHRALVPIAILLFSILAAGCVGNPGPAAKSAALASSAARVAGPNATFALAFDGLTPAYAEACAWAVLVGQCAGVPAPGGDFTKVRYEPQPNGTPKALHAVITWTAVSPATQQMTIFAGAHSGNDYKGFGGKMGPSPLKLDVEDLDVGSGDRLFIGLAGPAVGTGTPIGGASADGNAQPQPWKMTGDIILK